MAHSLEVQDINTSGAVGSELWTRFMDSDISSQEGVLENFNAWLEILCKMIPGAIKGAIFTADENGSYTYREEMVLEGDVNATLAK